MSRVLGSLHSTSVGQAFLTDCHVAPLNYKECQHLFMHLVPFFLCFQAYSFQESFELEICSSILTFLPLQKAALSQVISLINPPFFLSPKCYYFFKIFSRYCPPCPDIAHGLCRETSDHLGQPVTCISLSNDGNCILAGCLDSTLRLIDR